MEKTTLFIIMFHIEQLFCCGIPNLVRLTLFHSCFGHILGRIFCTGKHRSSPAFLVSELLYFCPDRWDIIMGIYFIGDSTSEPNHIVLMGVPVVPRKAVAEVSKIGDL